MTEHSELVSEMTVVEKMSTQERLKHARKRRVQQLKRWNQREQQMIHSNNCNKRKKTIDENGVVINAETRPSKKGNYKVHFVPSVMLLEAAARNDIHEVRRLLMLGVSPDSTNEDGLTALHQCCIDDSEEMMRLLLEFGANVNAKDSEQWTPLHAAATCGHLHLVKHLVSRGQADLLAVNADGNMPYDICEDELTLDFIESEMAKRGITQSMIDETRALLEKQMLFDLRKLAEAGTDLDYRDYQGAAPLHIAAANGYLNVVEFLLDNNVATDVCDNDLWQPIHAAACWGHPDVIELLVISGADLYAKTKNGETPFDICEDPELKERILQLRSEIETKRASQPHKIKRSQSQNTRSQSVRRTSIRDKSLLSRREAREEARLRHGTHEDSNITDEDDEAKVQKDLRQSEKQQISSTLPELPNKQTTTMSHMSLPPKVKSKPANDANEYLGEDSDVPAAAKDKIPALEHSEQVPQTPDHQPCDVEYYSYSDSSVTSTPVISRNQNESVKVEIHVTVNTNPPLYPPNHGTLADLKKHRSDLRTRSTLSVATSQQDVSGKTLLQNGHLFKATYLYNNPPSPTISLRRFCSDPSEVVGEVHKQGCCTVM